MKATLRFLVAAVIATVAGQTQDTVSGNSVVAKLDATITPRGALQANLLVTASGEPASLYRGASLRDSATSSPELFGNFVLSKASRSRVQLTDADPSGRSVQVSVPISEADFLLPIHRQQSLTLDLLPLVLPSTDAPDGPLRHTPVTLREDITIAIPTDFIARLGSPVDVDRAFARYRSEAKMEAGQLIVVRELVLKEPGAVPASQSDLDSFGNIVRDDRHHAFILRRTSRVDPTGWIQSVPPARANHYCVLAYQQREYEASRQLCQRAIGLNPEDGSTWNNLGRTLAALGDLPGAQKAYEKQIAINPADHFAYNNLGLVQERQGHWDAAIENLRKQIEVHPGDSYVISNLPRALIHAGRWAEAEAAASRALETQPNNLSQRLNRTIAHVCQGKSSDPGREIGDALGPRPSAALLNNAAYYLTECGKESELAESYGRQALDRMASAVPSDARNMPAAISSQGSLSTYLDTYGWLLFKQGKFERAAGLIEASTTLAPRGEVYAHLAEVESKAGHPDRASLHWREAAFLEPGQISSVPAEVAAQFGSIAPLSLDRVWYPLQAAPLAEFESVLHSGQPSYFFVMANADGAVQSVRELDVDDQTAKKLLPAVRAIAFPVVQADGRPLSTVSLVKVVMEDGKIVAARSIAPEAIAIASDLAPGDFPLPESTATPPPSTTAGALKISSGITQPRRLQSVAPYYSEEARRAFLAGRVLLRGVVDTDGKPGDFQVLQSLGLGLDESAIASVSKWRFEPGQKDGRPVKVSTTFEVNFTLSASDSKPNAWRLAAVEFHTPPGARRPTVERAVAPNVSGDRSHATATVSFDIDEQGSPVSPRIDKTSDQRWAKDVLAALAKGKFTPAVQDGRPLAASCTMTYERGQ